MTPTASKERGEKVDRQLAEMAGLDLEKVRAGDLTDEEYGKLAKAMKELSAPTDEQWLDDLIASWIIIEVKDPDYVKQAKMRARQEFRQAILTELKKREAEARTKGAIDELLGLFVVDEHGNVVGLIDNSMLDIDRRLVQLKAQLQAPQQPKGGE